MTVPALAYLRVIAICLIVNEQLADLYPSASLACGGYQGNMLFYFVSGYGLALSQQRNPKSTTEWMKLRFLGVLIPFVAYVSILNVGNLQQFAWVLQHNLLVCSVRQLQQFFPVLWILYLVFLPLNSLHTRGLAITLALFLGLVLVYYLVRTAGLPSVPRNVLTTDLFFLFSGISVFVTGILVSRIRYLLPRSTSLPVAGMIGLAAIITTEALQPVLYRASERLAVCAFYLTILGVLGWYVLFNTEFWGRNGQLVAKMRTISSCSLAVYFVHFRMIGLAEGSQLSFPYNVIVVFLYSFIFSYGLSAIAGYVTTKVQSMLVAQRTAET